MFHPTHGLPKIHFTQLKFHPNYTNLRVSSQKKDSEKGPHHGSPQNCLKVRKHNLFPTLKDIIFTLQVEETECKLGPIPLETMHFHGKVSDIPGLWAN